MAINCLQMKKEDIFKCLKKALFEFPITSLEFFVPKWVESLSNQHPVKMDIIEKINHLNREVIFLGDGVPVFADIIRAHVSVPFSFAPNICNRQRAAVIGFIGMQLFLQGKTESAAAHAPEYLRLSQAERELKEKNAT